MDVFDVLADPVRRRMLGLLAERDHTAGELAAAVGDEFGISQPAASRHLRVLRDQGIASSRVDAQRRIYRLEPAALDDVFATVNSYRRMWNHRLDALDTEIARRNRRDATS